MGNVFDGFDFLDGKLSKLQEKETKKALKGKKKAPFTIIREFQAGMRAAMFPEVNPTPEDNQKSKHWQAGYEKGYPFRKMKNDLTDGYLVSIGYQPQTMVKLAEANASLKEK